jgi:heme/copper-type cytochrome/quinol oxidase subunit 3
LSRLGKRLRGAPHWIGSNREFHVPGEAGVWALILGDMTVFALLFGVYTEARSHWIAQNVSMLATQRPG